MEEIQPFQTQQFQLNFSPTATTTEVYTGNSTFTVPTGTPICSPPVASGTPFNGVLSVSLQGYAISTLYNEFGGQMIAKFPGKCAAAGQQGLSQPFNFALGTGGNSNVVKWSAVLTGPDTAFFTLSGINGTLPQAGNTQVTLTALGLSSTSGLTRLQSLAGLNALLTFTLTDSGDNVQVYPVPVWEQLQGVYLVWGESDLVVPDQSSTGLTLYNWNGFGTGVTLTSNSTAFPLTAISSNAQLNRPVTATVSDNNAGTMATTTITASVAASLPLCAPVPPPLDVSRGP